MSELERVALQKVIDDARAIGVDVPREIHEMHQVMAGLADVGWSVAAVRWVEMWETEHPGEPIPGEALGCCDGAAYRGPEHCSCWVPVYAVDQAPPRPPKCPEDLEVQPGMCGDCAFRKDSPERSVSYTEDALLSLPRNGTPFWCHQGMRRPDHWEHSKYPQLGVVPGDPDNWRPEVVAGIPYRADGRPGLLCNGWATRAMRATPR